MSAMGRFLPLMSYCTTAQKASKPSNNAFERSSAMQLRTPHQEMASHLQKHTGDPGILGEGRVRRLA
jgi:hypothetical protein